MPAPPLLNRRDFTRELAASAAAAADRSSRPQVAAIYFPSWHRYDHMDAWHGYGWSEWELVKSAPPRFPGHYQPLRPAWGFFDDSDPRWSGREIDLAADHGVDVFLYDWYWYSGVRLMEESLEKGFLQAPNRDRLKFALMWANHNWGDYFPVPYDQPFPIWLTQRHSPEDLQRLIDYCIDHYFRQPNYWALDGRLFFSVFQPQVFISQLGGAGKVKSLLAAIDARLSRAQLSPIHWNAMMGTPDRAAECRDAGFHSTTCYNITSGVAPSPSPTLPYDDLIQAHTAQWKGMAASPLPNCPTVTMGWDVTPRCEHGVAFPFANPKYPYGPIVVGNTPERFGQLCQLASNFAAADSKCPPAVLVNAWNEWTEGSYLLPEQKHGNAYLEALQRAFASRR